MIYPDLFIAPEKVPFPYHSRYLISNKYNISTKEDYLRRKEQRLRREEYLKQQYGLSYNRNNYQPKYVRRIDGRIYEANDTVRDEIKSNDSNKDMRKNSSTSTQNRIKKIEIQRNDLKKNIKAINEEIPIHKPRKHSKSRKNHSESIHRQKINHILVEEVSDNEDEFAYSKSLKPSLGEWIEPML